MLAFLASKAVSDAERASWEHRQASWESRKEELGRVLASATVAPPDAKPKVNPVVNRRQPRSSETVARFLQRVAARPRGLARSSILSYGGASSVTVEYAPIGVTARCDRCGRVLQEHRLRVGVGVPGGLMQLRKWYHHEWYGG